MSVEPAVHPPREILESYAEGRLDPADAHSVEQHLLACEICGQVLEGRPEDDLVSRLRRAGIGTGLTTGIYKPFATSSSGCEQTVIPSTTAEPLSAPPGYEVIGELGRGGMGVVYKARQVALNRIVALKVVLAGAHASVQLRTRFFREAKAAAGVGHAHVVHVYETGTWAGQPYLALEYCSGGTLAQRLRGSRLSAEAVAALIETLARALQAAHERGVVHRDLKPQNVLLAEDGTPKVADFGLAKLVGSGDGLTASGAVMGTPSYMAPEQAAGERGVGPAADVYAIGAILYECLTGRPPFRGPTDLDTIVQVLEQEPTDPAAIDPRVDRDLADVALKCLEKNPEVRYPSAAALADDLGRWQRGEPVRARRRWGLQSLFAWARREPGLAVRFVILSASAIIVHLRYRVAAAMAPAEHRQILVLLVAWALVSLLCQACLRRGRHWGIVTRVWLGSDAMFLTGVLAVNRGHDSPLVVSYALLIVASGLWLRVELVRFTTLVAVLAYSVLVGQAAFVGDLRSYLLHHLIAIIILLTTGSALAYQVRRVRLLQRYFGHDRSLQTREM